MQNNAFHLKINFLLVSVTFPSRMLLLSLPVMMMIACTSGSLINTKTAVAEANAPEAMCNQIVRYHIEKAFVTNENGGEKEDNTSVTLTVVPGENHMLLTDVKSGKTQKTVMQTKSCSLTAGMKSGNAEYEFIETDRLPDGTTRETTLQIKLQASNGVVQFSFLALGKKGGMKAAVTHWETLKELDKEATVAEKPEASDGGWSIDASRKIFSKDSIVKGDYTLLFYVQSPNFDSTLKRRMIETFFKVYPKQVAHYNPQAPKTVVFLVDPTYQGVAAALGNMVRFSPEWFAQNPEDIDVVTHEVMHVVQGYNYATVPFWVTEGIADYGRAVYGVNNEKAKWELLKPFAQSHFQDGYKITARFFVWLEEQYKVKFVKDLNGIAAAGTYTNTFWNARFSKSVEELWDEYRLANNLEPQPPTVSKVNLIVIDQALDSVLKEYAAKDAQVKNKFEVSGEMVFGPNVFLPPNYTEGRGDYLSWYSHPAFADRRHTLINRSVGSALKFAYGNSKMAVVYDSARLFPALDETIFKKRYCFDIIVPGEKEDELGNIFFAKIKEHFKITTRIDSLEQTVLVLKKVEGFVFAEPDMKAFQNKANPVYELFMQGIMNPHRLIFSKLNSFTSLPIIDETGLVKAYDFGFRSDNNDGVLAHGTESKEVAERLKQHGLRLERAIRKYPALIISR
ncbi:DUF3738 domain-containing protein [Flavisolibacter sp. BT320]|nr:DUF3738 domain-containing protein [Flavisolibacter longurius]